MGTNKDNMAVPMEEQMATTLAEQEEILAILKLVRKYVRMYLPLYILLSAFFILSVFLLVVYASEFEWHADWGMLLLPVLFIFFLAKIHLLAIGYIKGYRKLKRDMVSGKKKVVTGNIRRGAIENNMFVYQLYGGNRMVKPKDCFSGWKITEFVTKAEENVTLHFLANSLLLLKAIYKYVSPTVQEKKYQNQRCLHFYTRSSRAPLQRFFLAASRQRRAGQLQAIPSRQHGCVLATIYMYGWVKMHLPSGKT